MLPPIEYYPLVVLKLLLSFTVILLFFQFGGAKRQFTQMTSVDLISNFILGAIIGGFIYNNSISFVGFLFIMVTYFAINLLIHFLKNNTNWGRKLIVGAPTVLVNDGKLNIKKMKKMNMSMTDFMSLLRKHEVHSLSEIKLVQIEIGGGLTVAKKGEANYAILLVDDGKINTDGLEQIKKDEKWLKKELKKQGINKIEDVFAVQWLDGEFYVLKS